MVPIRSVLARPVAAWMVSKRRQWERKPTEIQEYWFRKLLDSAQNTEFGRNHYFKDIRTQADFREAVPVRDYEALKPYVEKVTHGEPDILWPGKPLYFAKTSGTTSGIKYIPLSHESIGFHINGARDALLSYVHETGKSGFLDKKLIFLSGSPEMIVKHGIHVGRLSGIVNHHVPGYLRTNQLPSWETNCIDDWETKLDRIIDETLPQPMSLISGIPPWVQMYFDRIIARTGKQIKEVFPEFQLFVYGGVNFEPYRAKLFDSIGKKVDSIETYPASEGFIAYQDSQIHPGLLLLLNQGVYYEFIPAEEFFNENPTRVSIQDVEIGKNYAVIMNTNAGLWGYNIGDTVKFVSKDPYRLVVTGRIKHFISAFGEHVIGEEVEKAMQYAVERQPETRVVEFTVAPQVTPPEGGLPYHEWFVEFDQPPGDLTKFNDDVDRRLTELNVYYDDLITGSILRKLKITTLRKAAFIDYMKGQGKLGGQNKVPRLSNDRKIAEELKHFAE
ncbi:MAG: GH3 auxin-responsive promoter family protein [Siphonobacter aquaeclarae]|nr:GH3 auxin-responsive promoter family protein [Siphonobacter aquaeclarae]